MLSKRRKKNSARAWRRHPGKANEAMVSLGKDQRHRLLRMMATDKEVIAELSSEEIAAELFPDSKKRKGND